jgi:hypothetical protein
VNENREYESMSGGDPNRFPRRRLKFKRAGITHFQRPLLEKDVPEAEKLLAPLTARANEAFLKMSEIVDLELENEADPAQKVLEELDRLNKLSAHGNARKMKAAWSKADIRENETSE